MHAVSRAENAPFVSFHLIRQPRTAFHGSGIIFVDNKRRESPLVLPAFRHESPLFIKCSLQCIAKPVIILSQSLIIKERLTHNTVRPVLLQCIQEIVHGHNIFIRTDPHIHQNSGEELFFLCACLCNRILQFIGIFAETVPVQLRDKMISDPVIDPTLRIL